MDKERTGSTKITAKKEERLAELQQKAAELTSKIGEAISPDEIKAVESMAEDKPKPP